MSQQQKVGTHRTTVATDASGVTRVTYHSTVVVEFDHKTIILRTCGYRTATTKTRMNQASNQFSLGYSVFQKNYEWYVTFKGQTYQFKDGITIHRREMHGLPQITAPV